jgi:L-arabinonolactonase
MPEALSTFSICANPRFALLGLASRLAFCDFASGAVSTIMRVEPRLNTRINDGRCDHQGRFVFGTQHLGQPPRAVGGFYRLGLDLRLERLPLPAPSVSNSIAFSPDGGTLYFCDSPSRTIQCCRYHADGRVDNLRIFTQLSDATGQPDGATVDSAGGLWNAQWGGARVVRYGPDGVETLRVEVPTHQPSCIALGGPGLDRLYITSARQQDRRALARDPHAGGLFMAAIGHRGLPEAHFGASPGNPGTPE